jgi:hypothetical protein
MSGAADLIVYGLGVHVETDREIAFQAVWAIGVLAANEPGIFSFRRLKMQLSIIMLSHKKEPCLACQWCCVFAEENI